MFSINPEDALSHALLQLTEHKIGALLVLNEQVISREFSQKRDNHQHFSKSWST